MDQVARRSHDLPGKSAKALPGHYLRTSRGVWVQMHLDRLVVPEAGFSCYGWSLLIQKNQAMKRHSSQNSNKTNGRHEGIGLSVSELLSGVLEPVLARRTGMRIDLLRSWPEIVGEEFGPVSRPEKINWPRRISEDDPFRPATLIIACEPSVALFMQHSEKELRERVNSFFGFEAIGRIRISQKPVRLEEGATPADSSEMSMLEEKQLREAVDDVEDPQLRETLLKLGRGILSKSR